MHSSLDHFITINKVINLKVTAIKSKKSTAVPCGSEAMHEGSHRREAPLGSSFSTTLFEVVSPVKVLARIA
jgi:hypothetical protein